MPVLLFSGFDAVGNNDVSVCDRPLELQRHIFEDGIATLTAVIPEEVTKTYGGRPRLAVAYNEPPHGHHGWVIKRSFCRGRRRISSDQTSSQPMARRRNE
jgi:hypothetical protein